MFFASIDGHKRFVFVSIMFVSTNDFIWFVFFTHVSFLSHNGVMHIYTFLHETIYIFIKSRSPGAIRLSSNILLFSFRFFNNIYMYIINNNDSHQHCRRRPVGAAMVNALGAIRENSQRSSLCVPPAAHNRIWRAYDDVVFFPFRFVSSVFFTIFFLFNTARVPIIL